MLISYNYISTILYYIISIRILKKNVFFFSSIVQSNFHKYNKIIIFVFKIIEKSSKFSFKVLIIIKRLIINIIICKTRRYFKDKI